MVTVYSKEVDNGIVLSVEHNVSKFGYFQRNTVREMAVFLCKALTKSLHQKKNVANTTKHEEYECHVYVGDEGINACAITSDEYPRWRIHKYLRAIIEEFVATYGTGKQYEFTKKDENLKLPGLQETI